MMILLRCQMWLCPIEVMVDIIGIVEVIHVGRRTES